MPRRTPRKRQHKATKENKTALAGARNAGLCAQFQERYAAGGDIREHAKALGIAERTAYRWAGDVKINLAEHIRRICSDADLAKYWVKQLKATRGNSKTRVLENITKIRDGYPIPKEVPAQGPVIVIFDPNLENYKHAAGPIIEQGGFQDKPQGDAGSRPPAGAITRRSLRDTAEGRT